MLGNIKTILAFGTRFGRKPAALFLVFFRDLLREGINMRCVTLSADSNTCSAIALLAIKRRIDSCQQLKR